MQCDSCSKEEEKKVIVIRFTSDMGNFIDICASCYFFLKQPQENPPEDESCDNEMS